MTSMVTIMMTGTGTEMETKIYCWFTPDPVHADRGHTSPQSSAIIVIIIIVVILLYHTFHSCPHYYLTWSFFPYSLSSCVPTQEESTNTSTHLFDPTVPCVRCLWQQIWLDDINFFVLKPWKNLKKITWHHFLTLRFFKWISKIWQNYKNQDCPSVSICSSTSFSHPTTSGSIDQSVNSASVWKFGSSWILSVPFQLLQTIEFLSFFAFSSNMVCVVLEWKYSGLVAKSVNSASIWKLWLDWISSVPFQPLLTIEFLPFFATISNMVCVVIE